MTSWEDFFKNSKPPTDFGDIQKKLHTFCDTNINNKIALVTSGGTTVPLEHNTVRFVDNFSAGTRGAASTEYFLAHDYAVIFLYRLKSVEPYVRHFNDRQFLNLLQVAEDDASNPKIEVSRSIVPKLAPLLKRYRQAVAEDKLLFVDFVSVSDYLWLLREACLQLGKFQTKALVYLAAAVSDFYIPADKIPEHKIQSDQGAPVISLQLVPKMLTPLVSLWVPQAFVISFKLETDPDILISKARKALNTYKHKIVIGNILSTRRTKVIFVELETHYEISLDDKDLSSGIEIEEKIVQELVKKHDILFDK